MRTISLIALSLALSLAPAQAETTIPKMKHVTIIKDEPAKPAPKIMEAPPEPEPVKKEEPAKPVRKAIKTEEALVKPDELKEWPDLARVVTLTSDAEISKMIEEVEADPGRVPPTGLLFLAKVLADKGRFEEAALYYYAGQLRANFDVARWPPRASKEDMARIAAEQSKGEDQQGQTAGASEAKIINPHESVFNLSAAISTQISAWLFADPDRAVAVLAKVKLWDESAKYEYKPGYDLPEALPFDQWPKLLASTREGFFRRMNEFVVGLKKVNR